MEPRITLIVLALAGWPLFLFAHYYFSRKRDLLTALVSMILPLMGLFVLFGVVACEPSALSTPRFRGWLDGVNMGDFCQQGGFPCARSISFG